jgi:hypothetical protein
MVPAVAIQEMSAVLTTYAVVAVAGLTPVLTVTTLMNGAKPLDVLHVHFLVFSPHRLLQGKAWIPRAGRQMYTVDGSVSSKGCCWTRAECLVKAMRGYVIDSFVKFSSNTKIYVQFDD